VPRRLATALLFLCGCLGSKAGSGPRDPDVTSPDVAALEKKDGCEAVEAKLGEAKMLQLGGHLHRALVLAEEADAECSSPDSIAAIGEVLADLGLTQRSIAAWKRYIPVAEDATEVAEVEAVIAELEKRPPPTRSGSPDDKARALLLYRDGVTLRLRGQHERAIKQLRRSYAVWPHPLTIVQIAMAHDSAGRAVEGRKTNERALAIAEQVQDVRAVARLLRGHHGNVRDVAWSPAGRVVASISMDGSVKLWEAATGQVLHTLAIDRYGTALAFSADGGLLAGGGAPGHTVSVWDASSGKRLHSLAAANVVDVAIARAAEHLAMAHRDGVVSIWKLDTGEKLRELTVPGVRRVAFSPTEDLLATAGAGSPALWDASTGRMVRQIHSPDASTAALAFARDGSFLATAGEGKTVYVWDLPGAKLRARIATAESVRDVAVAGDGALVTIGMKWIRIWAARGFAQRIEIETPTKFNTAVAVSPDGATAAVAGASTVVRLWDTDSGALVKPLGRPLGGRSSVAFSSDGRWLASGGRDGGVTMWRLDRVGAPRTLRGHDDPVQRVLFSPDSRGLVSVSEGRVVVWDARGRKRLTIPGGSAAAYTADSKRLAVAVAGTVELRDAVSLDRVGTFPVRGAKALTALAFSPDGRWLAMGAADFLRVADARTGKGRMRIEGTDLVVDLLFSSDGRHVVSAGDGEGLFLWEAASPRQPLVSRPAHSGMVEALALRADGTVVASVGRDHQARLWDARTLEPRGALAGHLGPVRGVAFSADSSTLATASDDKTVMLWDVAQAKPLATIFSATDGRWVVLTEDGRIDGTLGKQGGQSLVYWQVGEVRLPGFTGWDRAHSPGLLREILRRNR